MGLDCSHDAFSGGYARFNHMRYKILSAAVGRTIIPFEPKSDKFLAGLFGECNVTYENLGGEWKTVPEEPLMILIAHADNEGFITPEHCILLHNRILELMPEIEKIVDDSYQLGLIQAFAAGCLLAHSEGERLEFR